MSVYTITTNKWVVHCTACYTAAASQDMRCLASPLSSYMTTATWEGPGGPSSPHPSAFHPRSWAGTPSLPYSSQWTILNVANLQCLNFCLPHPFCEAWPRPSLFPSEMLDTLKQSSFLQSPHQAGPACASKLIANSSNHGTWRFFHFHTQKSVPRFSHWASSSSRQIYISQLGKILNLNTGHTLCLWHQISGCESNRIWVLWRHLIPNPSDMEQEKQNQCVTWQQTPCC